METRSVVMGLPTDAPDLSRFLAKVQSCPVDVELTSNRTDGLLVICHHEGNQAGRIWRIDRHLNVLDEEYFHFSWPETTRVIDDRDAMHRRGWAYFQISGRLGDSQISGTGRVPFVYASEQEHYPWLKIDVGAQSTLIDTPGGARIYDRNGRIKGRFSGGSFFKGLPRPWMGLHCVDTIRRDAAECRLRFETACDDDGTHVKVTVHAENTALVYTVDMETDIIETIGFFKATPAESNRTGQLNLTYLQEIPESADESFDAPAGSRSRIATTQETGLLWLVNLTRGQ